MFKTKKDKIEFVATLILAALLYLVSYNHGAINKEAEIAESLKNNLPIFQGDERAVEDFLSCLRKEGQKV